MVKAPWTVRCRSALPLAGVRRGAAGATVFIFIFIIRFIFIFAFTAICVFTRKYE